ncbi:MAG: molybdenum cofactor biosynthesis protein MoaE [Candidatus Methylomirabilales bacterium]
MKVRIKAFAGAREALRQRELVVEMAEGATVAMLLDRLVVERPALLPMKASLRVAVNREYAEGGRRLSEDDEVALIPPVSGGLDLYAVTDQPLALDPLVQAVSRRTSGAVASFLGIVREFSRGRQVQSLEYEAYPEMATAMMRKLGEEIRGRWSVDEVAMVHRTGPLTIGEASVAIVIAAPHRREALEACAYAIERLKAVVPIWKKEVWTDGAEWIGSTVDEYRELQEEKKTRNT